MANKKKFQLALLNKNLRSMNYSAKEKAKYKREKFIELLKMKAKELGRMPKKVEINKDPRLPSSETYRKHIGNLPELAKIVKCKSWKYAGSEEVLEKVKKLGKKLGRMPTYIEVRKSRYMPSPHQIVKHFGSFKKLGKELGLPSKKRFLYSDKELLRKLRLRAEKLGKTPTVKEVESAPSLPSINTYVKRFGSLGRALELIGWKGRRKRRSKKQ